MFRRLAWFIFLAAHVAGLFLFLLEKHLDNQSDNRDYNKNLHSQYRKHNPRCATHCFYLLLFLKNRTPITSVVAIFPATIIINNHSKVLIASTSSPQTRIQLS